MYYYENFNVTTMNQPDQYRKIIVVLEPCQGVVYLFVRRTKDCWPNAFSCCASPSNSSVPSQDGAGLVLTAPPCSAGQTIRCEWTHFNSVLDGTADSAPTFFEVPFSSTRYYITVYAPPVPNLDAGVLNPRYRLMVLTDVGAYPRPGLQGRLQAKLAEDRTVELAWDPVTFVPAGISDLKNYYIYSTELLAEDVMQNGAVVLGPAKVLNTVCGLAQNAVTYGNPLTNASCSNRTCTARITGLVPNQRYLLNVVAVSYRSLDTAYSGIIVSAAAAQNDPLLSNRVAQIIGAIGGTIFGISLLGYLWTVKLYS